LPTIDEVLPNNVGTGSNGCKRIKEGEGEPDGYDSVLLSESLTCADAGTIMTTNSFANGKLNEAYYQRNNKQENQNIARNLSVNDVANGLTHKDGKVETPHIKAQIFNALYLVDKAR